jgi:hypothetical protein
MRAELVYIDTFRDLALLTVVTDLPPLEVEPETQFRRGQEVTVIGNPGSNAADGGVLINAVSRGVMSTRTTIQGQEYYQLNIAINPGNSGGPVIDPMGRVVGVLESKEIGRESLAFCIPAPDLLSAIARYEAHDFGPAQSQSQAPAPAPTPRAPVTVGPRPKAPAQAQDAISAGLRQAIARDLATINDPGMQGFTRQAHIDFAAHQKMLNKYEMLRRYEATLGPEDQTRVAISAGLRQAIARDLATINDPGMQGFTVQAHINLKEHLNMFSKNVYGRPRY